MYNWFLLQVFVCSTAFFVVQTALHAASRTIYAFSRDHGMLLLHKLNFVLTLWPLVSTKRTSRCWLLRQDLKADTDSPARNLVDDIRQYSSRSSWPCQPCRCQCHLLLDGHGPRSQLRDPHFLQTGVPRSPWCHVQTWTFLYGQGLVGNYLQHRLHRLDDLHLRYFLTANCETCHQG